MAVNPTKVIKGVTGGTTSRAHENELTWTELQWIEGRRRKIIRRQGRKSFFRILFYWDGTLLRMLAQDRLMRLTMGIYALIRVGAHLNLLPSVLNTIGGADIGIIGAFLSFFLVIFVNDSSVAFERLFGNLHEGQEWYFGHGHVGPGLRLDGSTTGECHAIGAVFECRPRGWLRRLVTHVQLSQFLFTNQRTKPTPLAGK